MRWNAFGGVIISIINSSLYLIKSEEKCKYGFTIRNLYAFIVYLHEEKNVPLYLALLIEHIYVYFHTKSVDLIGRCA